MVSTRPLPGSPACLGSEGQLLRKLATEKGPTFILWSASLGSGTYLFNFFQASAVRMGSTSSTLGWEDLPLVVPTHSFNCPRRFQEVSCYQSWPAIWVFLPNRSRISEKALSEIAQQHGMQQATGTCGFLSTRMVSCHNLSHFQPRAAGDLGSPCAGIMTLHSDRC